MKKIGRSTKQISGLVLMLAMLVSGLVPPGVAQQRKAKEATATGKDVQAENHIPDPPGKIAFASDRDGNFEIYVMNPDGGGLTRLTEDAAEDTQPTWSPDGTRIAFVSNRDGNREIYVIGADGSGLTRLTNNTAEDIEPAWSPSLTNQQIAFVSHREWQRRSVCDGGGREWANESDAERSGQHWSDLCAVRDVAGVWEQSGRG